MERDFRPTKEQREAPKTPQGWFAIDTPGILP